LIPNDQFADLLEIWNFCYTFKHVLQITNFSQEELYKSMESKENKGCLLFFTLIQSLISAFMRDIKEFPEKEMYSTNAILALEMSEILQPYPLETISLIFSIKKYKKCVPLSTQNLCTKILEKSSVSQFAIYELSFMEKKEILLNLTRALSVSEKIREYINKTLQDQKDLKSLEKQRNSLQKEIDLYEAMQKMENPQISDEKKREMKEKMREHTKICYEIKKRSGKKQRQVQSEIVGCDAEDREYWTFKGDKRKIYVREKENDNEKWGTYSKISQIRELLNVLIDKGINEKKLKQKIENLIPNMNFYDPDLETNSQMYYIFL